ncbi:response regulator [candidate division KSB1 bacterium]|nr:response regulator [candidate division KSB1 bacterium]
MPIDVIIASEDPATIGLLSTIFLKRKYSITIEISKLKSIVKVLDESINLVVLDLADDENSIFDYLKIIKKTRPKVKIIIICDDTSLHTISQIRAMGIFYVLLKPIRVDELEHLLDALESKTQFNFNTSYISSRTLI